MYILHFELRVLLLDPFYKTDCTQHTCVLNHRHNHVLFVYFLIYTKISFKILIE